MLTSAQPWKRRASGSNRHDRAFRRMRCGVPSGPSSRSPLFLPERKFYRDDSDRTLHTPAVRRGFSSCARSSPGAQCVLVPRFTRRQSSMKTMEVSLWELISPSGDWPAHRAMAGRLISTQAVHASARRAARHSVCRRLHSGLDALASAPSLLSVPWDRSEWGLLSARLFVDAGTNVWLPRNIHVECVYVE